MENSHGLMAESTKDNGLMDIPMEKEYSSTDKGLKKWENGMKVKEYLIDLLINILCFNRKM